MSKVVCIKDGTYEDNLIPRVSVGNVYTVIKEYEAVRGATRYLVYELEEMGPEYGYGVWNFAPCSQIDETEFERDYKKRWIEEAGEVPMEVFNQLKS